MTVTEATTLAASPNTTARSVSITGAVGWYRMVRLARSSVGAKYVAGAARDLPAIGMAAGILLMAHDVSDDVAAQSRGLDPQILSRGANIGIARRIAGARERLDLPNASARRHRPPVEQRHLSGIAFASGRRGTAGAGTRNETDDQSQCLEANEAWHLPPTHEQPSCPSRRCLLVPWRRQTRKNCAPRFSAARTARARTAPVGSGRGGGGGARSMALPWRERSLLLIRA